LIEHDIVICNIVAFYNKEK